jgi:hypothetical protein
MRFMYALVQNVKNSIKPLFTYLSDCVFVSELLSQNKVKVGNEVFKVQKLSRAKNPYFKPFLQKDVLIG